MRKFRRALVASVVLSAAAPAAAQSNDFNPDVLAAVHLLGTQRAHGKYDLDKRYSQPLDYSRKAEIPQGPSQRAPGDHETMCVAAVAEVMVEAINHYVNLHPEAAYVIDGKLNRESPYYRLPAATWAKGDVRSIRPYIFIQGQTANVLGRGLGETPRGRDKHGVLTIAYARGTGQALATFRVGEELTFSQLQPGDFLNFNRTWLDASTGKRRYSGHSVVFLNYISKANAYTTSWSPDVIGFEYFSAQGMKPKNGPPPSDAGFARRDAYFGTYQGAPISHPRDRNVIRPSSDTSSANADLGQLNGGRLWVPTRWRVSEGLADIERRIASNTPTGPRRGPEINTRLIFDRPETPVDFSDVEN